MKLSTKVKFLTIPFTFIIGVGLIYFVASQFFGQMASKEINIGLEEEKQEETAEIKKTDYLAPDFELSNINGEKVKLADYKNKIIIIGFWTTWNPAAQDQLAILESYYQKIKDSKELVLLTINNQEDKSVVTNFIRRGQYTLPVLLDEEGRVGELYKISTLPATYFINQEGKVKDTYIGILSQEEIKNKVEKLYTK